MGSAQQSQVAQSSHQLGWQGSGAGTTGTPEAGVVGTAVTGGTELTRTWLAPGSRPGTVAGTPRSGWGRHSSHRWHRAHTSLVGRQWSRDQGNSRSGCRRHSSHRWHKGRDNGNSRSGCRWHWTRDNGNSRSGCRRHSSQRWHRAHTSRTTATPEAGAVTGGITRPWLAPGSGPGPVAGTPEAGGVGTAVTGGTELTPAWLAGSGAGTTGTPEAGVVGTAVTQVAQSSPTSLVGYRIRQWTRDRGILKAGFVGTAAVRRSHRAHTSLVGSRQRNRDGREHQKQVPSAQHSQVAQSSHQLGWHQGPLWQLQKWVLSVAPEASLKQVVHAHSHLSRMRARDSQILGLAWPACSRYRDRQHCLNSAHRTIYTHSHSTALLPRNSGCLASSSTKLSMPKHQSVPHPSPERTLN